MYQLHPIIKIINKQVAKQIVDTLWLYISYNTNYSIYMQGAVDWKRIGSIFFFFQFFSPSMHYTQPPINAQNMQRGART